MEELEDLDETVERIAAVLQSEDLDEMSKGYDQLVNAFQQPGTAGRERFARLAQELAACNGGRLVESIFAGALGCYKYADADIAHDHYGGCCMVSALLTSSKVVVERLLGTEGEERQCAQEIYETMLRDAMRSAQELKRKHDRDSMAGKMMVVCPLECLSNFARGSRVFRDGIHRLLNGNTLFQQLGYFVSAEFLNKLSDSNAHMILLVLSNLVKTLALSSDSQLWALNKGLLRILAAIYKQSPAGQLPDTLKGQETLAFRCNMVLLCLLESNSTTEKLRAHNALSGFRPHRDKISSASPGFDIWCYIEGRLIGLPVTLSDPRTGQRLTVKSAISGSSVPVVCSWKQCTAGPEPVTGKKFAKCSACKVARYCSKEHQRLHWANHKRHCQADRIGGGDRKSIPG